MINGSEIYGSKTILFVFFLSSYWFVFFLFYDEILIFKVQIQKNNFVTFGICFFWANSFVGGYMILPIFYLLSPQFFFVL